jgi:UDP-N-acetylglucosamine:LPS N-acetylglucosamine transferase
MKKKILILTAGFGEGHNSAARGVRDGLARIASDQTEVDLRDLFAEAYGRVNDLVRRSYLALVNSAPRAWGLVYRWLDRKTDYDTEFQRLTRLKAQFAPVLDGFQPDIVVCSFPAYANVLQEVSGAERACKCVVVVTDSITINASWYRSPADYFIVANEQSANVLRSNGIAPEKIRIFGFPVSPKFADFAEDRPLPSGNSSRRVLYMINAAKRGAPELVRMLAKLNLDLTVTIGRDDELWPEINAAANGHPIKIVGWTNDLPRMMHENHLLIGKAGGATVQETIAAKCPMIINHVVAGQEEGNARLIVETNSGAMVQSPREVVAQVRRAFDNGAKQWREWAGNISKLSRPRAALDIAEFLMSL